MRVAAFGDIHGNVFALQAVLRDLRKQSPDAMVIFGDLTYKFPWGVEVVDLVRSFPHQAVLGNSELYLILWDTPLWPHALWNAPLALEVVQWERERLGAERLAWLAGLPEYVAFTGSRLEDLIVVHGVPGNPFVPFLNAPGQDRSPWVQTEARVRQLLNGVDAEAVICGHTHTRLRRRVALEGREGVPGGQTTIANPGGVGYGRGRSSVPGIAHYALLDWSAGKGWQISFCTVEYDPAPINAALSGKSYDYPLAGTMAHHFHTGENAGMQIVREHFRRYRWGDPPEWWEERDDLPAWQALRGHNS